MSLHFLAFQVKEPVNCGAKVIVLNDITYRNVKNYVKHIRPHITAQPEYQGQLFVNSTGGPVSLATTFPRHWFDIFKESRTFNPYTMKHLVSMNKQYLIQRELSANWGFSCDIISSQFFNSLYSWLPCWFPFYTERYWKIQQNELLLFI